MRAQTMLAPRTPCSVETDLTLQCAVLAGRLRSMAIDLFTAPAIDAPTEAGTRLVEAADEERRRAARELRDGPLRELRDLALDLRLSRGIVAGDAAAALAVLDEATARLDAAADALGDVARDVFPAALDQSRGLSVALGALAQRAGVDVTVAAAPAEPLARPLEAIAYAIAAEGIANAVGHGGATLVEIEVRCEGVTLSVRVTDDGVGGAERQPGGRLEALCDRVAALGGHLSVESPHWAGTALHALLPVD
jgi:signal transduction histidine kinase